MAEIVNLNRVKKRLARARDAAQAGKNRIRFGRTAAEKQNDRRSTQSSAVLLDGKLLGDVPASS